MEKFHALLLSVHLRCFRIAPRRNKTGHGIVAVTRFYSRGQLANLTFPTGHISAKIRSASSTLKYPRSTYLHRSCRHPAQPDPPAARKRSPWLQTHIRCLHLRHVPETDRRKVREEKAHGTLSFIRTDRHAVIDIFQYDRITIEEIMV